MAPVLLRFDSDRREAWLLFIRAAGRLHLDDYSYAMDEMPTTLLSLPQRFTSRTEQKDARATLLHSGRYTHTICRFQTRLCFSALLRRLKDPRWKTAEDPQEGVLLSEYPSCHHINICQVSNMYSVQ